MTKTPQYPVPTEHQEQVALFKWRDLFVFRYTELELLYAIPNGGHRHKATAVRLKREGVMSGIPDVHLPIPRGRYGSLYIELKRQRGGVLSQNQKKVIEMLQNAGNRVEICAGCAPAIAVIKDYLSLKP